MLISLENYDRNLQLAAAAAVVLKPPWNKINALQLRF
jgi:hypothetical protein